MLSIKDLSFSYGKKQAINQLSFSIKAGEIIGFLGANGAGKSTTLKLIAGLLSTKTGYLHMADKGLNIGYLPENNPVYEGMYVKEWLYFFAGLYGLKGKTKHRRVDEMIDTCHLTDVLQAPMGTLSKGYKQRAGLARVLLPKPHLLLLDEATSGLDPQQKEDMYQVIKQQTSSAVLFSTHILSEVNALCTRVLLLKEGTLVKDISCLLYTSDAADE